MNTGYMIVALCALAAGIMNLFVPEAAFFFREGWKFRDAKPSGLFIFLTQISGMVFIAIGVLFFVLSFVRSAS